MNLTEEDLKQIESHVQNLHESVGLNDETLIDITKGIANYKDKLKYLNIPVVIESVCSCDKGFSDVNDPEHICDNCGLPTL